MLPSGAAASRTIGGTSGSVCGEDRGLTLALSADHRREAVGLRGLDRGREELLLASCRFEDRELGLLLYDRLRGFGLRERTRLLGVGLRLRSHLQRVGACNLPVTFGLDDHAL